MSVISPTVNITIHSIPTPTLTLGVDKIEGYLSDVFNFTGNFAQNGAPVIGETVTLYRNGVAVGSVATDSYGDFLISWVADVEGSLSFHTEAAIPPRPPILSRSIGIGVGIAEPSLIVPLLAVLGGGALLIAVTRKK